MHHRQRADSDHQIGLVSLQDLLQRSRDKPWLAVAAIVGADDEFVGVVPEFVLPEHEILGTEAHDCRCAITGFLERPQLRIDRSDAQAAANQHDMSHLFDVLRQAQGTDKIRELVAFAVFVAHLARRLAERLHDNRDRSALAVVVGNRQWDALAPLVEAHHDEVTGQSGLRHVGSINIP